MLWFVIVDEEDRIRGVFKRYKKTARQVEEKFLVDGDDAVGYYYTTRYAMEFSGGRMDPDWWEWFAEHVPSLRGVTSPPDDEAEPKDLSVYALCQLQDHFHLDSLCRLSKAIPDTLRGPPWPYSGNWDDALTIGFSVDRLEEVNPEVSPSLATRLIPEAKKLLEDDRCSTPKGLPSATS